jgi:hypothetical protein
LSEHFEHLLRPLSAGVAVPIFAFFAAGVAISGLPGLTEALSAPITIGIVVGLVVGKTVGIFATSYLVARFTRAALNSDLRWMDVLGVAALAGIGFTVSLLIGDLAYGVEGGRAEYVKIGVLTGSVLAAAVAAVILRSRNRDYRDLAALEERDSDADGIPDVYAATMQTQPTPAVTGSAPPPAHHAAGTPRGRGPATRTAKQQLPSSTSTATQERCRSWRTPISTSTPSPMWWSECGTRFRSPCPVPGSGSRGWRFTSATRTPIEAATNS